MLGFEAAAASTDNRSAVSNTTTNVSSSPVAPPSPPIVKTEEEVSAEAEAERAAAEVAVTDATSALDEVSTMLDALNDDSNGTVAITLTADDTGAFFDLIDTTVALAVSAGLTEAAGDANTTSANTTVSDAAADAVTAVVDGLSVALARGLEVGESVAVESETMVLVVEKAAIPTLTAVDNGTDQGSGEELLGDSDAADTAALALLNSQLVLLADRNASTSAPAVVFTAVTPSVQASFASFAAGRPEGSAPIFLVPLTLDVLEGASSVDVQAVEYKESTRRTPPPSDNVVDEVSSSITSLSLRAGGSTLVVENSSEPVLIAMQVAMPTRRRLQQAHDCRSELEAVDACTESLATLLSLIEAQKLACDDEVANAGVAQQVFPECQLVPPSIANYTAEAEACATLPIPCSGRGTCDADTGLCSCTTTGWHGGNCDVSLACRYWDTESYQWSSSGLELTSIDDAGSAVCASKHLTDFAVMSSVLQNPDQFFSAIMTVEFNLPQPLSLEDLVRVLSEMAPGLYAAFFATLVVMIGLLYMAVQYDDTKYYVEFYPHWVESCGFMTGRFADSRFARSVGTQLVLLITTNHFLAIFFVLPTMPTTHAQRLVTVYQIVLTELAVLILFYNTSQDNPFALLWAQIIDSGVVIIIKVTSVGLCHWALLRRKELDHAVEEAKLEVRRANKQWHRVLRQQTKPRWRSSATQKIAFVRWRNDNLLMNRNFRSRQFFDARLANVTPAEYRDHAGRLHFKMVLRKRNALGLSWPARKTTTTWTQESTLGEPAVRSFNRTRVASEHRATFGGLRSANGTMHAPTGRALKHAGSASVLETDANGVKHRGLYALGASEPNASGKITGWAHSKRGSVVRADVYLASPACVAMVKKHGHFHLPHLKEKANGRARQEEDAPQKVVAHSASPGGKPAEEAPQPLRHEMSKMLSCAAIGLDEDRESRAKAYQMEAEVEAALAAKHKAVFRSQHMRYTRRAAHAAFKRTKKSLNLVVPEGQLKSSVFSNYTIRRLANVPESCLLRQADGSVGFFAFVHKGGEGHEHDAQQVSQSLDQEEEALLVRVVEAQRSNQAQLSSLDLLLEAEGAEGREAEDADPAVGEERAGLQAAHAAKMGELEAALDKLAARRATHDMTAASDKAKVATWRIVGSEMFRTLGMDAGEVLDADESGTAWPTWVPVVRLIRTRRHRASARSTTHDDLTSASSDDAVAHSKDQRKQVAVLLRSLDAKRKRQHCCGLNTPVMFTAMYKLEIAGRRLSVDDLCVEPMAIHRRLAVQYQRRRLAGWTHDQAMAEMNQVAGLPVVWKGARPFTGEFDPRRLRVSWAVNAVILLAMAALLCWDYLSITAEGKEMDWSSLMMTFVMGVFLAPVSSLVVAVVAKAAISRLLARRKADADEKSLEDDVAEDVPLDADDAKFKAAYDVVERYDALALRHLQKIHQGAVAEAETWHAALLEAAAAVTPPMAIAAVEAAVAATGATHGRDPEVTVRSKASSIGSLSSRSSSLGVSPSSIVAPSTSDSACGLGTRVYHELLGAGTVTQLMPNGRTRVLFDQSGEEQRYKPSAMQKLQLLRAEEVGREHRATMRDIELQNGAALQYLGREKQFHETQLRRIAAMGRDRREKAMAAYLATRHLSDVELEALREKLVELADASASNAPPTPEDGASQEDAQSTRAVGTNGEEARTTRLLALRREPCAEHLRRATASAARAVVDGHHVAQMALLGARNQLEAEAQQARVLAELEELERARHSYPVGERVRHPRHGVGTVKEHLLDGRTRVAFDKVAVSKGAAGREARKGGDGSEHRYTPSSLHKLTPLPCPKALEAARLAAQRVEQEKQALRADGSHTASCASSSIAPPVMRLSPAKIHIEDSTLDRTETVSAAAPPVQLRYPTGQGEPSRRADSRQSMRLKQPPWRMPPAPRSDEAVGAQRRQQPQQPPQRMPPAPRSDEAAGAHRRQKIATVLSSGDQPQLDTLTEWIEGSHHTRRASSGADATLRAMREPADAVAASQVTLHRAAPAREEEDWRERRCKRIEVNHHSGDADAAPIEPADWLAVAASQVTLHRAAPAREEEDWRERRYKRREPTALQRARLAKASGKSQMAHEDPRAVVLDWLKANYTSDGHGRENEP